MFNNEITKMDKWGLNVRGIIKNCDNKILLIKRNSTSQNERDKWEFPGGKVENGEYFEKALIREFKEETNLNVSIKGLYDSIETKFNHNNEPIKTVQIIMNVEIINKEEFENLKISSEHEDYKWFTITEIKEFYNKDLLTLTVKKVLKKNNLKI